MGYRILLIKFSCGTDHRVVVAPMFDKDALGCDTWDQTMGMREKKEL